MMLDHARCTATHTLTGASRMSTPASNPCTPRHNLADLSLESLMRRLQRRRAELDTESDAALLVGRLLLEERLSRGPCIRTAAGIRPAPRDGRGRLLSKAWLLRAEMYSAEGVARFRSPVSEGK